MDLSELLNEETIESVISSIGDWFATYVFVGSTAIQLSALLLGFFIAWRLAPKACHWLRVHRPAGLQKIVYTLIEVMQSLMWLVTVWLAIGVAALAGWPYAILRIAASLLTAWIIIKLASRLIREPLLARGVTWIAWVITALSIVNLLDPTIAMLDSKSITLGTVRISAYTVIKSTLALGVLLWVAMQLSRFLERRIHTTSSLSPSVQVLLSKSLTIVLFGLATLMALTSVGIDLTALAVVGGAIGLGVGFGLQKIASNLISGVILLLDKSIKPGDVIAVADTYGWVNTLGARYVSVFTRDGTEHLIPNETLITERVENWTHTNRRRRIRVPVGVHYKTDVKHAIELCERAATGVERVIEDPAPVCLLIEFGDNSVNLELRFWINDSQNGIANVRSAVLLRIWELFHQEGIEIPYPQRDLHLRTIDRDAAAAMAGSEGI